MLSIYEELYLLAVDEEKGVVIKSANQGFNYALAGAILADMAFQNKTAINAKGRLELVDPGDSGDPILDPLLHKILSTERQRRWVYWISIISAKPKKLRRKIEASLYAKNVILREDDRFLGIAQVDQGDNSYSVKLQLKTSFSS